MARPKIRKHEARILQAAMDNLSIISERNETLLDDVDYGDLMDRVSGAMTDLAWIIDYADRLEPTEPASTPDSEGD